MHGAIRIAAGDFAVRKQPRRALQQGSERQGIIHHLAVHERIHRREMSITKIGALVWAAILAYAQPDPAMLRNLYEQNLASQQRRYGEFDAHTAEAARDLGLFLRRYANAKSAYDALSRAVVIDEKVFGADAPRTLSDVADLASVAPLDEAFKLFERAAKSSDAAAAARALIALGEARATQGDREGASKYWRMALAKQEAVNPDSTTTAMILNILAQTVEPGSAVPLFRRALLLDRKLLGPAHPEVGATDQLLCDRCTVFPAR